MLCQIQWLLIHGLCGFFIHCMHWFCEDELCDIVMAFGPCRKELVFPALVAMIAHFLFKILLCNKKWGCLCVTLRLATVTVSKR